jgi:hypothetical protein
MAEPEIEIVSIKSNTDALSERAIHDTLVSFVRNEALMGEVALKALVPKRSMAMAAAAGHKGPYDEGLEITAYVGIPEIPPDESDPSSGKYPIFVDSGTGIFADHGTIVAKEHDFMHIPASRGGGTEYPMFLKQSKGQEGKHFMAATFAVMINMLQTNAEVWKTELTSKLDADKTLT